MGDSFTLSFLHGIQLPNLGDWIGAIQNGSNCPLAKNFRQRIIRVRAKPFDRVQRLFKFLDNGP